MKKSMAILTFLLTAVLVTLNGCFEKVPEHLSFQFNGEDVDYMYIVPHGDAGKWEKKILISKEKTENSWFILELSEFPEAESYDIMFHTVHKQFIEFYDVKLSGGDSAGLFPADDYHENPYLSVMIKSDRKNTVKYRESKVTDEY